MRPCVRRFLRTGSLFFFGFLHLGKKVGEAVRLGTKIDPESTFSRIKSVHYFTTFFAKS